MREADTRWHGYLANISPSEFESRFAAHLPERMTGAEFLARYDGITDIVTRVDPDARVSRAAGDGASRVRERARRAVRRAARRAGVRTMTPIAREMGALMGESHASYSACGLGSDGTDRLVELVREAGPSAGLFGAKITGGGSGGTVAVLGTADAEPAVREIARRYAAEAGGRRRCSPGRGRGREEEGVVLA